MSNARTLVVEMLDTEDAKAVALSLPAWTVSYLWIEGPTIELNGRTYAQTHRGAVVHRQVETVPARSKTQAKRYVQARKLPHLTITSVKPSNEAVNKLVNEMVDEDWHDGWQPTPMILAWFRQFLAAQNQGSMWASPTSGLVYRIDKTNKTLTLVAGDPHDERNWHKKNIVTLAKLGWTVLPNVISPPDQSSFAESEEDDPKAEIDRLTTPVPNERGVLTFKHRGSTLSIDTSLSGYFIPVIQPIHYGSDEEANDGTGAILYTDALLSLRHKGHTTVKAVLDAYIKWGTVSTYQREEDIEGHPKHILGSLDIVRDWPSTNGKVATLRL